MQYLFRKKYFKYLKIKDFLIGLVDICVYSCILYCYYMISFTQIDLLSLECQNNRYCSCRITLKKNQWL